MFGPLAYPSCPRRHDYLVDHWVRRFSCQVAHLNTARSLQVGFGFVQAFIASDDNTVSATWRNLDCDGAGKLPSLTFFAELFIVKLNVIDEATTQVLSVLSLKSDPSAGPR